jgi:cell wall-associated NlpC family hydrolase
MKSPNKTLLLTLSLLLLILLGSLSLQPFLPEPLPPGPNTTAAQTERLLQLPQGSADSMVGITPPHSEVTPLGPQALTSDENGQLYLLDSLNQRVFKLDPQTQVLTTIPLSHTGFYKDLVVRANNFYLLDLSANMVRQTTASGHSLQTYPFTAQSKRGLSGLSLTAVNEVRVQNQNASESPLTPQTLIDWFGPQAQAQVTLSGLSVTHAETTYRSYFTRLNPQSGHLQISTPQNQAVVTLSLTSKYHLGSMLLQAVDNAGNFYVLVDQLLPNVPAFVVDTALYRFDSAGNLLNVAPLPIGESYFLPQRYVTITNDGQAYFLQVQAEAATILRLAFSAPEGHQPDLEAQWQTLQTQADSPPASPLADIPPEALPETESQSLQASISRAEIRQNALAYLNLNWTLTELSYGPGNLTCDDNEWALPGYLEGKIGQNIPEMAYRWGGYSTIEQFLAGVQGDKLAGDACTCADPARGYCINRQSVGVDCSGFVSRVWATNRYTTRSLPTVSSEIAWDDLAPGDVVNWAGRHVMLFEQFVNGGVVGPEASSDCNWRVCFGYRTYAHLNGNYIPRRYNNLEPDPAPQPTPLVLEVTVGHRELAPGGQTLISGQLRSPLAQIVTASTRITFSTSLGQLTPPAVATDRNHFATVVFTAPQTVGRVFITATNGLYTGSTFLDVRQR